MPSQEYEIITGIAVAVLIFLSGAIFIVALVLYLNGKKKLALDKEETMRRNFEAEILKSQIEIRDQTAANISQEIHDNIAQGLTLAKLNLSITNPHDAELVGKKMVESRDLVGKAIQDLRDLARALSGSHLNKFDLRHELEQQLDLISKVSGLTTSFSESGTPVNLDVDKQLILFRMAQEAFVNTVKHAKAKTLHLFLNYTNTDLVLRVEDNGLGFGAMGIDTFDDVDREELAEKLPNAGALGLGIRNMESRAKLLGGTFTISSSEGSGTRLEFIIPLYNVRKA